MSRAWGCLFGLYPEDVASDKRLDVTVISSAVSFKIVLQKGLTVDFESLQVLACLASQSRKMLLAFLAQFFGGSRFTWWMVRTNFRLFLTSYNVPLESLTSFLCRLKCCSLKWSNEKIFWAKKGHVRDV